MDSNLLQNRYRPKSPVRNTGTQIPGLLNTRSVLYEPQKGMGLLNNQKETSLLGDRGEYTLRNNQKETSLLRDRGEYTGRTSLLNLQPRRPKLFPYQIADKIIDKKLFGEYIYSEEEIKSLSTMKEIKDLVSLLNEYSDLLVTNIDIDDNNVIYSIYIQTL